jgi:inhibitor of growth protein 3
VHEQLEGAGMPVARLVTAHAVALVCPGVDRAAGGAGGGSDTLTDVVDGVDDGAEADDGRLYRWCQLGSFGNMVARDDDECEHESVGPDSVQLLSILSPDDPGIPGPLLTIITYE